jgi:hypothetical protein
MTTVNLSAFAGAGAQFFSNTGVPLAGGLLYTYAAGTTTSQATYTTNSGSIANANPIVLDSTGRVTNEIWLIAGDTYKFVLQDSTGSQIGSWDNIPGINDLSSLSSVASISTTGASLIGFKQGNSSGFYTGAVSRTVQAKLEEQVSVLDFGVVGNGTTDDTTALTNALNSGASLYFPSGLKIKLTSGLTFNLGTQSFYGNNTILDFSSLTGTATAITLGGTNSLTPSDLSSPSIVSQIFEGFIILGPGKAGSGAGYSSTVIGINASLASACVSQCTIYGFGYGVYMFSNGYVQSIINTNIGQCAYGVYVPSGGSNYGERMSFVGCDIYDCQVGISNNGANSSTLMLTNCSVDYNAKQLVGTNTAITEFHNCWLENNDAGSGNVSISLSDSQLTVVGGHIVSNGSTGSLAQAGYISTDSSSIATFTDVYIFNEQNTANVFDSGSGNSYAIRTKSAPVSYLPSTVCGVGGGANKLADGGFEQSTIIDYWTVVTAGTLAISSAQHHSGSQSLEYSKGSGGATGGFIIVVPCNPQDRVAYKGWWLTTTGSGGIFAVSGFGNYIGSTSTNTPTILNTSTQDTNEIAVSASTGWTSFSTGMDRVCPSWANCFYISFNAYSFSGNVFLDDFVISKF